MGAAFADKADGGVWLNGCVSLDREIEKNAEIEPLTSGVTAVVHRYPVLCNIEIIRLVCGPRLKLDRAAVAPLEGALLGAVIETDVAVVIF